MTAYARDLIEVLDSVVLDTVEQNTALRRVLREITPQPEVYRIVMEPIYHVVNHDPPATGIVIHVTATEVRFSITEVRALRAA